MTLHTGGCQCGAVRFACDGDKLGHASICHCRMCQKAFGAYYAPLVSFSAGGVSWTRGQRKLFRSSNHVSRGFCGDCGTPLTYEADGYEPSIAAGAFDDPAALPPTLQYGIEALLPFVDTLADLPRKATEETFGDAAFLASITNYQHPDHDTALWPPVKG